MTQWVFQQSLFSQLQFLMLVSQSLSWTVKSFHSIPVSESEKSESESHTAHYKGQRLTLAASLHEYSQTRRGSDHTSTAHHRPHTERNNCENLFAHETSAHHSLNAKLKHQITANYLADSNVSLHANISNHCQPKKIHWRPLLISFNTITSKLYFLFILVSADTLSATWHQGMTALLLTLL